MHVWSFWEGPKSQLLEDCQASWKKYLQPQMTIHLLNYRTMRQWGFCPPAIFWEVGKAAQSDLLRLWLLGVHGGLWMDATILLHKKLDSILPPETFKKDLAAFQLTRHQYLESWFLLVNSEKGQTAVFQWYRCLVDLMNHPEKFVGVHVRVPFNDQNYFRIYKAFVICQNINPSFLKISKEAVIAHCSGLRFFSPTLSAYWGLTKWVHKRRKVREFFFF